MNIHALLEKAKFSKKRIIAYHGTSMEHLHSILKNGLLINYGDEGLGRGDYSDLGFTLDPHGGVYVTTNFNKAKHFAKYITYDNPLVIVLQVQPKSIHLDEDEILSVLGINENEILRSANKIVDKLQTLDDDDKLDKYIDQVVDNFYHVAMSNLKTRLLKHYNVDPTTTQKVVELSSSMVKSMFEEIIDAYIEPREADIRHHQERLLKLFKHVVRGDSDKMDIFQIPANVGFRGSNKIVGFINPINGKKWFSQHANVNIEQNDKIVNHPKDIIN